MSKFTTLAMYFAVFAVFVSVIVILKHSAEEKLEHKAFVLGCMDSGKLNKTECEALYKERK
jgi:hypothetical protein